MTKQEINTTMRAYAKLLAAIEAKQQEADAIKEQIKAYMQAEGLQVLQGSEHKAQSVQVQGTRLDAARLKKEAPGVYEAYSVATSSTRFIFK